MRPSERRAALGLLSVGAVLVSAAGLAYLGAVSYRADRGIVAGAVADQRRVAQAAATEVEASVAAALEAAVDLLSAESGTPGAAELESLAQREPLASRPFRIGARGELWIPGLVSMSRPTDPVLDVLESRPRPTAERESLLYLARRAERGNCSPESGECVATAKDLARARAGYLRLVKSVETGPAALLGLSRVAIATTKQDEAVGHYRSLGERVGQYRDADGISFSLWADLGVARLRADTPSSLAMLEAVLERRYVAPEPFLAAVVAQLRERLDELELSSEQAAALRGLTDRLSLTRAASTIYADLTTVSLTAGATPRGEGRAGRTLVYRRLGEREVVGIELEPSMFKALLQLQAKPRHASAQGAQLIVHQLGTEPSADEPLRTLASTGFGSLLPNLVVSMVQPTRFRDPLDEIIRERSRRHLLFSGALGLILVFGLLATIRGTARERELAKLKSDFVSTVSHELKTPLTSIRMFAEMLQQGVAGQDRDREEHYHDIIVKESERLGLLIANLLDYSQVERGARRYALLVHDAREIAHEALATFKRLAEGEGRELVLEVGDGEASQYAVRADREVLIQSLLNLLGNAAKYSDERASVTLKVAATEDWVRFAITDKGPGIPAAEHRRIFREFYRSPEAQRSGVEGTGLGLALVKRHAAALGGEISVESVVGSGSTFTLSLPRASEER